ncbi:GAF domain-containing sensor histidine kinase [Pseudochryseolinea flava]|uniref:histidine kinase n=1 Tax=Pseudochryseolinea flava TaxID=2059302 RepID=A0A364Y0J7_9BACT|nr:GAF domain-containing sensor histidine kinase [Pseudochryseolinea flava]RAV99252.1 sensor histidine kinase [Pseudochryseolinea flava]
MKHAPIPKDEKERLLALDEYAILDSAAENMYDEIVELASFICDVPISTITLVDDQRQWFKARKGIEDSETPRDVAFCAHAILQDDIMVVTDATKDDRFYDNPYVTNNPDIRFYAGMPLITHGGYKLGTLCVIDRKPKELSRHQYFALRVLRDQVMNMFELRKKNIELHRIHEMHNRLLSIIGHDLRGPINSIEGLLYLAERYDLSLEEYKELIPRMRQMLDTSSNLLLNLLHWAKSQIEGKFNNAQRLNLQVVVQNILNAHAQIFEAKKNQIVNNINANHVIMADRNRMEFVIRNLLLNANKYTERGTLSINSLDLGGALEVNISDSGVGIDEHRQNGIFSWTERNRTDGTRGEKGTGLGLPMCKEFVEEMGGKIWVTSKVHQGTTFCFTIPLAKPQ